jgi:hypothetical protein
MEIEDRPLGDSPGSVIGTEACSTAPSAFLVEQAHRSVQGTAWWGNRCVV